MNDRERDEKLDCVPVTERVCVLVRDLEDVRELEDNEIVDEPEVDETDDE